MRWYFKRKTEGMISCAKLYSYEALIAGLVSLGFFFVGDGPGTLKYAKMCTCIFMGLSSVFSAAVLIKERKQNNSSNLYDLLRCIVCGLVCIMSFTCLDYLLI